MKKGFTLIELLVVIAIIGILAVIIILNLASATEKSKYAKAKSELKILDDAITLAYVDGKVEAALPLDKWKKVNKAGGSHDDNDYDISKLVDSAGVRLILNAPETPTGNNWDATFYVVRLNGASDHQTAIKTPKGYCMYMGGSPIDKSVGTSNLTVYPAGFIATKDACNY